MFIPIFFSDYAKTRSIVWKVSMPKVSVPETETRASNGRVDSNGFIDDRQIDSLSVYMHI